MKNVIVNLLTVSFFIYSGLLHSQQKKATNRTSKPSPDGIYRCLSDEYNAKLLESYPEMMGSQSFEKKLQNIIKSRKNARLQSASGVTLVRIPVVVHVIHNGTAIGVGANISNAQVLSQIKVLNDDYGKVPGTRGENSHPDGADPNIEFYLAQEDPNGCFTTGIERYNLSSINTNWSGPGGNTDSVLKPITIWDSSRYLNMWTVTFSSNTDLGYAQFPGVGPANTDGVVMGYEYFGSDDDPSVNLSGSAPYQYGRTTTHEVGHFLSLFHTFQGGCNGVGDECDDTPAVSSANYYDCNIDPIPDSCPADPGLDMVENYMDYSNDECMNVFTNDQSARMDATLSGDRLTLANSTVSDTPQPSVSYDASVKVLYVNENPCSGTYKPLVNLTNRGTFTMNQATLSYNINGGTPVIVNWTGSLISGNSEIVNLPDLPMLPGANIFNISVSQPNGNTDQRVCNNSDSGNIMGTSYESITAVHLELVTDNYPEETSWEFRDSSNNLLDSDSYNPSQDNQTFNYVFNVMPNECYTFTIFDDPAAADGICCSYGQGSYELRTNDNTPIASGGAFGEEESVSISTNTLAVSNYFMANDISIYPNPTSGNLTVKLRTTNDLPNGLQVYNMLGQIVLSKSVFTKEDLILKTTTLETGMYFIRIVKDNASITLPFIKK